MAAEIENSLGAAPKKSKDKSSKGLLLVLLFTIFFVILVFIIGFTETVYRFTWQKETDSFGSETKNVAYLANGRLNDMSKVSQSIADDLAALLHEKAGQTEFLRNLQLFCKAAGFSGIKYFNGDTAYNMSGTKAQFVPQEILDSRAQESGSIKQTCYAYDTDLKGNAIEIYIPITPVGGVSGIITVMSMQDFNDGIQLSANSGYSGYLVDASGNLLLSDTAGAAVSGNIRDTLQNRFKDDETLELMRSIKERTAHTAQNLSVGDGVLASYQPLTDNLQWGVVNIKNTAETMSKLQSVRIQITLIGVLLGVLVLSVILYIWFSRRRYNRKLEAIESTDSSLGCYNLPAFQAEVAATLKSKSKSRYAILYMGVLNYEYISQTFGTHVSNDCLHYFYRSIRRIVETGELIGRASADRFVVLLRYTDDDTLIRRYETLYQYMYNYLPLKEKGYNLHIYAGIYLVDPAKNYTAAEMIERATIAFNSLSMSTTDSYLFYDTILRNRFLNKAEIESIMKNSLQNDEFLLYFQPKYGIKRHCIDSAEVLVRWHHPTKGLVSPMDFIPLFESNGFIVELDKYIYLKALQQMRERAEQGKRVVPLSINVSRISAIQPGFLKFYIENKHRYQIPDNVIELEFTESFALESYNTINDIVTMLGRSGIRCSIDDFGSGYSSFSVLKQLQMDVLKMDKLFLNKGTDPHRDKILISGIIELGKQFSMKIVQEGVETEEEYRMVRDLGCDAIQGYWYSQALSREEFETFADTKGLLPIEEIHG